MNDFVNLIGASVLRPKEAATELLALELGRDVAWMTLALSIVVTVLLSFIVTGGEALELIPGQPFTPFMHAIFLGCMGVIMGYAIYFTGNAMDGAGTLTSSILVVAWLQVLQFAGLVVQSFVFFISPGVAALISFAITIVLIWVLLSFVDVLHGFGSLGRSALLMLFVIVGVGLGLTLILGLIGVGL